MINASTIKGSGKVNGRKYGPNGTKVVVRTCAVLILFCCFSVIKIQNQLHRNYALVVSIRNRQWKNAMTMLRDGADATASLREDVTGDQNIWQYVRQLFNKTDNNEKRVSALQAFFEPEQVALTALPGSPEMKDTIMTRDRLDVFEYLISHGAQPNIRVSDNTFGSDVPLAALPAMYGHAECVKQMLQHGVDPNSMTSERISLLHFCMMRSLVTSFDRVQTVGILLDAGANPKIKDKYGDDPMYFAQELKDAALIELMKSKY
jgi:hypothetical protein